MEGSGISLNAAAEGLDLIKTPPHIFMVCGGVGNNVRFIKERSDKQISSLYHWFRFRHLQCGPAYRYEIRTRIGGKGRF